MEEDYDDNYSDGGSEGSLSEASDGADDQFAEVDASLVTARRSFACVNAADLKTLRDADVQQVAETLSCSASDAGVLLRAHGWNREKVISAYFENPEGVLDKSGVCGSAALRVNARADAPFRCPVCLDARTAYTALGCGHMVCTECFREYVVHKIDDEGPAVLRARCPGVSCPLVLTPELVLAVAPQDKSGKFLAYWDQSYVDDNPHFEWCPGPSCGRVLRLLQPPDALVPGAVAVACNCGQRFCFRCRQDDHSPASCEQLSKWLEKCKDDSETYNWLQANTRTCPECKTAIEKNGGCNHMVCKKCAFEWCWVCSGPWKEHSGNYYNCNRFKGSDDEESRRKDQSKAALERYLHYYTRYFNHHNSLKLEEKTRAETEKKIDEMQQLGTNTWLDVQYLKDVSAGDARRELHPRAHAARPSPCAPRRARTRS